MMFFDKVGGVVSTIYDMIFGSLSKKDNIDFLRILESMRKQLVAL